MHLWLIPLSYAVISIVCGLGLPRLEDAYFASYTPVSYTHLTLPTN